MGEWMRREYRSKCCAKEPHPVFSQEDGGEGFRERYLNQAGNGVHHEGHEEHEGCKRGKKAGGSLPDLGSKK